MMWILLPALAAGFGWLSVSSFLAENTVATYTPYARIICSCLAITMLIALKWVMKFKYVIESDKFSVVGIYKIQVLPIAAIHGFKQYDQYFDLIPFSHTPYKKMAISCYVERYEELLQWAQQTLTDLNNEETLNSRKEILNNEKFGATIRERQQKLNKTRALTRTTNIIAVVLSLAFWFLPHLFYQFQVVLCALIPIIALAIYKRSNGLIRLDEKPNSAHPHLFPAIIFPSVVLTMRSLMDFTIFSYNHFWMPAGLITIAFIIFIIKDPDLTINLNAKRAFFFILGALALSGVYTYGTVIATNGILDKTSAETYKVRILDKRISSGKTTYYYFKLSPWGPQKEIKEVWVTRKVYENKQPGDSATIQFKSGFYKIPFYFITE